MHGKFVTDDLSGLTVGVIAKIAYVVGGFRVTIFSAGGGDSSD